MRLRHAVPSDAGDIRAVHSLAFPTPDEADLVEQLVRDGDALISIVALENGRIVGHVLLSRMEVKADGLALSAAGLAPVAVVPDWKGRGIGSALIESAIDDARRLGLDMIFVLGEPGFYGRFGFNVAEARPFASRYAGPHFQVLLLKPDVGPVLAGEASYAPAFDAL